MRKSLCILALCLLIVISVLVKAKPSHAQTATPETPTPEGITVNVPSPNNGQQITIGVPGANIGLPSDTPLTGVVGVVAVIIGLTFLTWGGRQVLLMVLDVRKEREKVQVAGASNDQTIKLEDTRADNEIEVERTKQISALISAFSTLTPELHRMGTAVEKSTEALGRSTEQAKQERGGILEGVKHNGELFTANLTHQNALIETLTLTIKGIGDFTKALDSRQETLVTTTESVQNSIERVETTVSKVESTVTKVETLLTDGETSTTKKIGGQMNGIEDRIKQLERDSATIKRWLRTIADVLGAELSEDADMSGTEPKTDAGAAHETEKNGDAP